MSNSKKSVEEKSEAARRCLLCKKELFPDDWKLCDNCAREVYGKARKSIVGVIGMSLVTAVKAMSKKRI